MSFSGFPADTQRFLADLAANNERAWFEANRERYEAAYLEPAKAFVTAVGERLARLAPELTADARVNGSIFRINRDVRFSRDKTPYKENVDFWFWAGERRGAVSGLFVRVAAGLVGIGAGCHGFERERLEAYRRAVADAASGEALAAIVTRIKEDGYDVNDPGYKRLPRGLEELAGTPREGLARHDALFVYVQEPARLALDGGALLDTCERHWQALLPLHHWLVEHVQRT
jgi:uncharacterized protein (TIGR02453 family)